MSEAPMWTMKLETAVDTERLGICLGEQFDHGSFVALVGDLGAGKTSLAQAVARGLGVCEPVLSPTFTLFKQYDGRIPLYHFDLYRLDHVEQVWDLGWEEVVEGDGVCLVEWADKFPTVWPDEYIVVTMTAADQSGRWVTIKACGSRYQRLLEEMKTRCSF